MCKTSLCACGRENKLEPNGVCYQCECEAYALRVGVLVTASQYGPNREKISQRPVVYTKTDGVTHGRA